MPSEADIYLIGKALLNMVVVTVQLGHVSPGMSLDYIHLNDIEEGESAAPMIVRDFVAWTSGRQHLAEGAEERLRAWIQQSGYWASSMNTVADTLSPPVSAEWDVAPGRRSA